MPSDREPTTAARIDPAWPITTEDDPQRVYCSNPVCGGVDVHPHYHRKPGNAATVTPGHLDSWTWRTGELRDHLGHDHEVSGEAMVGLNRWSLIDLHTEKHHAD